MAEEEPHEVTHARLAAKIEIADARAENLELIWKAIWGRVETLICEVEVLKRMTIPPERRAEFERLVTGEMEDFKKAQKVAGGVEERLQ